VSIFASDTQQTIAVDQDPPHTVTIRRLRGGEYEQAKAEGLKRSARSWAERLQVVLNTGRLEELKTEVNDPLFGFDRAAVIKAGLIAWTYHDGATPTPRQIDDLDDDAMELIARAIVRLTKPALFDGPEIAQKETVAPASLARGAGAAAA
jgi:hypothetical protein